MKYGKWFFFLFVVIFINSTNIKATDINMDDNYAVIEITAKVPDSYKDNIPLILTQEDNDFNYSIVLKADNDYKGSLTVLNQKKYFASVNLTDNYYTKGLENLFYINGENVDLIFNVTEGLSLIESTDDTNNNNTSEISSKDEEKVKVNEEIGNDSDDEGQLIYKEYIDTVSFMKDDNRFSQFLKIYSNSIMKNYFLQADSLNTETEWEKMSNFDRWNYYILFVRTKTLILGTNPVSTENELLDELSSEIALLSNIQDGDIVIEAVKKVWRWEWKEWQYGRFVNLYDPYNEDAAPKYNEVELNENDSNKDNINKDNTNENKQKKDRIMEGIYRNIFSLIILSIIGIVIIVITIKKKKNKNY